MLEAHLPVIELLGLPGAGKSSLAEALIRGGVEAIVTKQGDLPEAGFSRSEVILDLIRAIAFEHDQIRPSFDSLSRRLRGKRSFGNGLTRSSQVRTLLRELVLGKHIWDEAFDTEKFWQKKFAIRRHLDHRSRTYLKVIDEGFYQGFFSTMMRADDIGRHLIRHQLLPQIHQSFPLTGLVVFEIDPVLANVRMQASRSRVHPLASSRGASCISVLSEAATEHGVPVLGLSATNSKVDQFRKFQVFMEQLSVNSTFGRNGNHRSKN